MSLSIKEINQLIEEGQSLKAIAQAYSEIANLKVKRIKNAVERNRSFFTEISNVYSMVKALALQEKINISKPKNKLCILLTSNYRFYGKINSSLFNYFVGLTRELKDVDRIVLGKSAVSHFKASKTLPSYQEVVLKTDMPTFSELTDLVKVCANYTQVLIFHSKFKSLLTQQATFTDITATSVYTQEYIKSVLSKEKGVNFIFEPELLKILQFFDHQVLTLLLEQTFLESELSRTASRFISMDKAENQANQFIKENLHLKANAKRNVANNSLLESFASQLNTRKDMLYG